VSGRPLLSAVAGAKSREEPGQERPKAGLKRKHGKHWATNLPGELGTKANTRRGQRAGMLSRSWLRFVLITVLNIANGLAGVNSPKVRPLSLPYLRTSYRAAVWCNTCFATVHILRRNNAARDFGFGSRPENLKVSKCRPLFLDCVAKLFFGVRTKFCRGAGALTRKLCRGSHDQLDFQPAAFVGSLRGVRLSNIGCDGRGAKFCRQLIFDFVTESLESGPRQSDRRAGAGRFSSCAGRISASEAPNEGPRPQLQY
jgi:hypothetical protein